MIKEWWLAWDDDVPSTAPIEDIKSLIQASKSMSRPDWICSPKIHEPFLDTLLGLLEYLV
jgi:hypothetical protein